MYLFNNNEEPDKNLSDFLIMTEQIIVKPDMHLKIFNPAGCFRGLVQLLLSAEDPYLKSKETSEQG